MNGIILVGGGGHCRSVIDIVETGAAYEIAGIVDRGDSDRTVSGYPVLGDDTMLPDLVGHYRNALVTIGQIASPEPRIRLFKLLRSMGAEMPVIVSPKAHVSRRAEVGAGTAVFHMAVVNAGASVGENCIVNSGALVEHDARIGDHCHVSTGALVNGGCSIGGGTFIGSGAVLHHGVSIGVGCVIGAGALVKSDVPDGTLVRASR